MSLPQAAGKPGKRAKRLSLRPHPGRRGSPPATPRSTLASSISLAVWPVGLDSPSRLELCTTGAFMDSHSRISITTPSYLTDQIPRLVPCPAYDWPRRGTTAETKPGGGLSLSTTVKNSTNTHRPAGLIFHLSLAQIPSPPKDPKTVRVSGTTCLRNGPPQSMSFARRMALLYSVWQYSQPR